MTCKNQNRRILATATVLFAYAASGALGSDRPALRDGTMRSPKEKGRSGAGGSIAAVDVNFREAISRSVTTLNRISVSSAVFKEAISRSATLLNRTTVAPTFKEAIGRSATLLNRTQSEPVFKEAIGRSATLLNRTIQPIVFKESVSRASTLLNRTTAEPIFKEAVARSATLLNRFTVEPVFKETISRAASACNASTPVDQDGDGINDCPAPCVNCTDGGNPCVTARCDPVLGCVIGDKPDGTACSDDGNACTTDACVAGACHHSDSPAGLPCGDPSASACDEPDSCDGFGLCVPNHTEAGTECAPAVGDCDEPDVCGGLGACVLTFKPAGMECRAANDPCDVAEFCTGESADCPPDGCAADGVPCDDGDASTTNDSCRACVCMGVGPSGAQLRLTAADGSELVRPGGTVTILLEAASLPEPINGVQVLMHYDAQLLSLVDVVPTVAGAIAWTEMNQIDNGGDLIYTAVIVSGSVEVDHAIATLTFTARAAGTTRITFNADDPPAVTLLTRYSDQTGFQPTKLDSGDITITCDDGLFCNGLEAWIDGACVAGAPPDCSALDGACSTGVCDENADRCVPTPRSDGSPCDDGLFCSVGEVCTGGVCGGGAARDCAGLANACNAGVCDEARDACMKIPSNEGGPCDDNLFCTTGETCSAGACIGGSSRTCDELTSSCTAGRCNEETRACDAVPANEGQTCDDGAFCTVGEVCAQGICGGGTPRDCSSVADVCNAGVCDEQTDACIKRAANESGPCDDGLFCTTGDTCHSGACTGGADRDCSSLDSQCAVGECDENADRCVAVAANEGSVCDDRFYCTVGEICHAGLCAGSAQRQCPPTGNVCLTAVCDESRDACVPVAGNEGVACDDGQACTVDDACLGGACVGERLTPAIEVTVEVQGLRRAVTREVTFDLVNANGGCETRVTPIAFAPGNGSAVGSVVLETSDTSIRSLVAVEGHTLARAASVQFDQCGQALVEFTGNRMLLAGDFCTDQIAKDNLVNIVDFAILAARIPTRIEPTMSCGADVDGNGFHQFADFLPIVVNLFRRGDARCTTGGTTADAEGLAMMDDDDQFLAAIPTSALPPREAEFADINRDGWVDDQDVLLFAETNGIALPPEAETRLRAMRELEPVNVENAVPTPTARQR